MSIPEEQLADRLSRDDELLVELIEQTKQQNQLLAQIAQEGGINVGTGQATRPYFGADLISSLSMRDGWRYQRELVDKDNAQPGTTEVITLEEEEFGIVFNITVLIQGEGGEKCQFTIETDNINLNGTPETLYNVGYIGSGDLYHPHVTVYDESTDTYCIAMDSSAGYHHRKRLEVNVTIPANVGEVDLSVNVSRILIEDQEKFLRVPEDAV